MSSNVHAFADLPLAIDAHLDGRKEGEVGGVVADDDLRHVCLRAELIVVAVVDQLGRRCTCLEPRELFA